MKSTTLASVLGASALLFSPVDLALADSTESFSHTTVSGPAPLADTFTLPTFNPSLGTLTGVEIFVQEDVTADLVVFNATANSQAFTNANASVPTTISGPGGASFTVTDVASVASGTAVVGPNDFPGTSSSTTGSLVIDPADFAAWLGGSGQTVSLNFTVNDGTFSGVAAPGVFFGGSAVVGGATTVTYTYITTNVAVPEPSTWALMIGGLGLLAFWRMRQVRR